MKLTKSLFINDFNSYDKININNIYPKMNVSIIEINKNKSYKSKLFIPFIIKNDLYFCINYNFSLTNKKTIYNFNPSIKYFTKDIELNLILNLYYQKSISLTYYQLENNKLYKNNFKFTINEKLDKMKINYGIIINNKYKANIILNNNNIILKTNIFYNDILNIKPYINGSYELDNFNIGLRFKLNKIKKFQNTDFDISINRLNIKVKNYLKINKNLYFGLGIYLNNNQIHYFFEFKYTNYNLSLYLNSLKDYNPLNIIFIFCFQNIVFKGFNSIYKKFKNKFIKNKKIKNEINFEKLKKYNENYIDIDTKQYLKEKDIKGLVIKKAYIFNNTDYIDITGYIRILVIKSNLIIKKGDKSTIFDVDNINDLYKFIKIEYTINDISKIYKGELNNEIKIN